MASAAFTTSFSSMATLAISRWITWAPSMSSRYPTSSWQAWVSFSAASMRLRPCPASAPKRSLERMASFTHSSTMS